MNTCIKCGCQEAYPSLPPCPTPAACPNPQPCSEVFDAQCIVFTLPDILCGEDIVVNQDDTIAEALDGIVSYFCEEIIKLTLYINSQLLIINNNLTTIEGEIIEINSKITSLTTTVNELIACCELVDGLVQSVTGLNTDNTDPQNPIVRISVDGTTITGLGTPASPLVATGGGGGVSGSGTLNYVAKWTPDGTTLGNSLIRDNGTSIGIGASPVAIYRMNIETSTQLYGLVAKTSYSAAVNQSYIGINGTSDGASTAGINAGVVGYATGNTNINQGGSFAATSPSSTNVGVFAQALGATSNYAIQLNDGTNGLGKVLTCVGVQGEGNWGKVTSTYTTGASGSFVVGAQTITVTNGLITSIV